MSKQQSKNRSLKMKYRGPGKGWLKRVRHALADDKKHVHRPTSWDGYFEVCRCGAKRPSPEWQWRS